MMRTVIPPSNGIPAAGFVVVAPALNIEGGSGEFDLIEVEFTNQTTVTVNHNLGRRVLVQVIGTDGLQIEPEINQVDNNSLVVNFFQATSGTIFYA